MEFYKCPNCGKVYDKPLSHCEYCNSDICYSCKKLNDNICTSCLTSSK